MLENDAEKSDRERLYILIVSVVMLDTVAANDVCIRISMQSLSEMCNVICSSRRQIYIIELNK